MTGTRDVRSRWAGPESRWSGGLAHWTSEGRAYLSVAFTWLLPEARKLARYYGALGLKVFAGGPALAHLKTQRYLQDVAWVPRGEGFPDSYMIDRRPDGSPISATVQGSCCGNSVPPPLAAALVAANCGHLAATGSLEAAE